MTGAFRSTPLSIDQKVVSSIPGAGWPPLEPSITKLSHCFFFFSVERTSGQAGGLVQGHFRFPAVLRVHPGLHQPQRAQDLARGAFEVLASGAIVNVPILRNEEKLLEILGRGTIGCLSKLGNFYVHRRSISISTSLVV